MSFIDYFEFNKTNKLLTVIITLRAANHYDMVERIKYRISDASSRDYVNFLVVDDGSEKNVSNRIKNICEELNFNFVRIKSEDKLFSPGRARNVGVQYAKSEFVVHEDVDLFPPNGYYKELLDLLLSSKLIDNNDNFISIPVIYLKENLSSRLIEDANIYLKDEILDLLNRGEHDGFEFYMPASSVILLNRNYYLSIGGYNENFVKWGLEDLEYAYRLTRLSKTFFTPKNFKELVTSPEFSKQTKYTGWRAQFRLHGEWALRKNLFLFHIFHSKDPLWRNKSAHDNNFKLFKRCIDTFEESGHYLPNLPDPFKGRTLMFGKGCFAYNRAMLPNWGEVDIKGYEFFEKTDIVNYIKSNSISRVVFTNPYANEQRLRIYNLIRSSKIPFYVVERGALRDSMFVDPTGFCSESNLCKEEFWDKEISEENKLKTLKYIEEEVSTDISLERQNSLIGVRQLRNKLNIPDFKKVIFVPLQSRSDTTTRLFAGDIRNYDNFIELVRGVVNAISSDWVVVVKRHPLSKVEEDIPGAIFANDSNVKDLIDLSNYVLLMNSGVGVLSTLWFKPVIYTAQCFYASEKLNRKAVSVKDVIDIIDSVFSPSKDDCIKFISYLINDFYSFGKMSVEEKSYTENANLTITKNIDYYSLNIQGEILFKKDISRVPVSFNSPFYDIFRNDLFLSKNVNRHDSQKTVSLKASKQNNFERKFNKLRNNPVLFIVDAFKNKFGKFI